MSSSNAVLLPKVFSSDIVAIGQLVPVPLLPNINPYLKGVSLISPEDVTLESEEKPHKSVVSLDTKGFFNVSFTRHLGFNLASRSANVVSIEADRMLHRVLKDTSAVFNKICSDPEAQRYIEHHNRFGKSLYLVIGLQSLENATIKRVTLSSGAGGGHVEVPCDPGTFQTPLQVAANVGRDKFGASEGRVNGVVGIQVLKFKTHIVGKSVPALRDQPSWNYSHQMLRSARQGEEKEVRVQLDNVDESDLDELKKLMDEAEGEDEEGKEAVVHSH